MKEKTKRNPVARFCDRVIKSMTGLNPSQSIRSLSDEEKYTFYRDLGFEPLGWLLVLMLIIFITSMTVGEHKFDVLLAVVFGIGVFSLLVKLFWPKFKTIKTTEREETNCKFFMRGNRGFLVYNNQELEVYDFGLYNGKLCELVLELDEGKEEIYSSRIYYSVREDKFYKVIERYYQGGLSVSYVTISWIYFSVLILCCLALIGGSIALL